MDPREPRDIWIFAEIDSKGLREVSIELASEGRGLADKLKERLCAVLLAGVPGDFIDYLSQFGVDAIYYTKAENSTDSCVAALSDLMRKHNPRLMLVGATPMGSEVAPRVAARNGAPIMTNCVIFTLNDRRYFEVTKMILEDKVYATLETSVSKTQIVTVVPGSFDLTHLGCKKAVQLVIESVEENLVPARVRPLRFIEGDPKQMDLTEAEIIVATGRGAGGLEGMQEIERLAEHLRGAVAGSRVAVDQGWLPFERQIGQTGKTVSPKLFVSCGISGAFEFTAGMKDSRLIVAINNDPKAPIFRIANLSLVGDLQKVVPNIVEQLEKRMGEETE